MLTFYKPNKSVKGSLANISFNSKGEKKGIFIEMVKQTAWDEATGAASFKNGEKVNVKLSLIEAAALIKAIEKNEAAAEKGFYHSSTGGSAYINFTPYARDGKQIGFSLSINKQEGQNEKKSFYIGFDFNESQLLKEFLRFSLDHIFSGMYSDALKARKESSNAND
jgi:hypothetical protein